MGRWELVDRSNENTGAPKQVWSMHPINLKSPAIVREHTYCLCMVCSQISQSKTQWYFEIALSIQIGLSGSGILANYSRTDGRKLIFERCQW